jgi:hypothetical protein
MISKTSPTSKVAHHYAGKNLLKKITSKKEVRSVSPTFDSVRMNKGPEFHFCKVPTGVSSIYEEESQHPVHSDFEKIEFEMDPDVKKALENYQAAINRYNYADLSDAKVENVYFLERQVTYISLQLALAKARIRNGMDPSLDYTSFESLLKLVGMGGE